MMGGCWATGVWHLPGQTAQSTRPWFSFHIISPNAKLEIEPNALMLEQVLYLLLMEVVFTWNTRTMWTCSAKIWQRLVHRTDISLHQGFQMFLLFLSPLGINKVCILHPYLDEWFSIGYFQFWPPSDRPWLCNLNHLVHRIQLSFLVFSQDSMHQTLHCSIQCLRTMLFHHSIILQIFRCTRKQLHHLITLVIECMETRWSSD